MAVIRTLGAYVAAVAVATALGSAFHTQMVLAGLTEAGAEISWSQRVASTVADFIGFSAPPLFAAIIGIGFAVGFAVAFGVKRIVKSLAPIAYPLAGAAAVAVMLHLMSQQYYTTTPIAGARGLLGFGLQCLAGAIGGLVFAMLRPQRR